ncbi:MAG: hypothetical protein KDE56_04045 [Anaerolineales bacterium]|nr:hypothetical protein [Anaerolineales bacterium]
MVTKQRIIDELDELPLETLPELQAFIEFLRFKSGRQSDAAASVSRQMQWQNALQAVFGMWADRVDEMGDSVTYVQHIRQGHRLDDWLVQADETD